MSLGMVGRKPFISDQAAIDDSIAVQECQLKVYSHKLDNSYSIYIKYNLKQESIWSSGTNYLSYERSPLGESDLPSEPLPLQLEEG